MRSNEPSGSAQRRVRVIDGNWDQLRARAMPVRMAVFVQEQGVPVELEQDEQDAGARHWAALAGGTCIGTVRLTADGHLGRLAVLPRWRRRGIGALLTRKVVEYAREHGGADVDLNAQTHAIPFYEALGFRAEGPVFEEAGLPHRYMRLARPGGHDGG